MQSARSYAAVSVMKGILMVPHGIISCDLRNEINQIILQNKVALLKTSQNSTKHEEGQNVPSILWTSQAFSAEIKCLHCTTQ